MHRVSPLVLIAALVLASCAPRPPSGPAGTPAPKPADPPEVSIGDRAPAFTLASIPGGEPVTMPSRKVTIVLFWATWSAPDMKELTKLQEIFTRHSAAGLVVIGLCVDDNADHIAEVVRKNGITFPIVWEADRRVTTAYRPNTDPSTYVVDREGIVQFRHSGYHDGAAQEIEAEAKSLLGRGGS